MKQLQMQKIGESSVGEIMKILSKELKGKADMKEVKKLVQECFKNNKG